MPRCTMFINGPLCSMQVLYIDFSLSSTTLTGRFDIDAFDAFLEADSPFDKATAERVRKYIYSAGNSQDPAELFRQFRGR